MIFITVLRFVLFFKKKRVIEWGITDPSACRGLKGYLGNTRGSLCFFRRCCLRTIVYVDGFNLYYRILKKKHPEFKWLNVRLLAKEMLPLNKIVQVNYYTAYVSAHMDKDSPRRQQVYLDALANDPLINIHFGLFSVHNNYAKICPQSMPDNKPAFLPVPQSFRLAPWPNVVRVIKTEEKGSDVNLGAHLVRDACLNKFDVAAVITNDTDLREPIRIAVQEMGKSVCLLSPVPKAAGGLEEVVNFIRRIRKQHLKRSQFPDSIVTQNGEVINKPTKWTRQGVVT